VIPILVLLSVSALWNALSQLVACPACIGTASVTLTLVQRFADSDCVVLALPTEKAKTFEILEVIKGGEGSLAERLTLSVDQLPQTPLHPHQKVLLARSSLGESWSVVGEISEGRQAWLRKIAGMKRTKELTDSDWEQRLVEFLPLLDDTDTLVRETAFLEMARAPYKAMRSLKAVLVSRHLLPLYDDPKHHEHRFLLIVLPVIAGGEESRLLIHRRVQEN